MSSPQASAVAAVGSAVGGSWRVPGCLGAAHQAGPEQLARLAPQLAQHPGVKAGQKMDGALERQKVAITQSAAAQKLIYIACHPIRFCVYVA